MATTQHLSSREGLTDACTSHSIYHWKERKKGKEEVREKRREEAREERKKTGRKAGSAETMGFFLT